MPQTGRPITATVIKIDRFEDVDLPVLPRGTQQIPVTAVAPKITKIIKPNKLQFVDLLLLGSKPVKTVRISKITNEQVSINLTE